MLHMIEIHKYIAKTKRLWINNWRNNGQKGYDPKGFGNNNYLSKVNCTLITYKDYINQHHNQY